MRSVDKLPFRVAIRQVMEDVTYSNALPEWYTPERIDEAARLTRLTGRAQGYINGKGRPLDVLALQVPRLTGGTRAWVVPAVNDQIILQACVVNLAKAVSKEFDRTRVFSCEPNDDPNRIAFMKPQISALLAFHKETIRRLEQRGYMLEFDIERAFPSIDRSKFFEFVERLQPASAESDLVKLLLNAWAGGEPGIPLVNDSVFFLGSAYLEVVDREVVAVSSNFTRYMDDYRVFGDSVAQLEQNFESISRRLEALGLKINLRKVRIGSRKDYLQPVVEPKPARSPRYVLGLDNGIKGQIDPEQLALLVARSLDSPDDFLNEGFGRYLLGAMRRYRLNLAVRRRTSHDEGALQDRLQGLLRGGSKVARARLDEYSKEARHTWRAIWVMYLIEQQGAANEASQELDQVEKSMQMPLVAKLWARRCRLRMGGEPARLADESLHDLSYVDAGKRCYGEELCKGDGF